MNISMQRGERVAAPDEISAAQQCVLYVDIEWLQLDKELFSFPSGLTMPYFMSLFNSQCDYATRMAVGAWDYIEKASRHASVEASKLYTLHGKTREIDVFTVVEDNFWARCEKKI